MARIVADTSQALTTFHAFRNYVYHIGIQHEAVLPAVAPFHFRITCEFLAGYPGKPRARRVWRRLMNDFDNAAPLPEPRRGDDHGDGASPAPMQKPESEHRVRRRRERDSGRER